MPRTGVAALRARQMTALAPPALRVVSWQPLATAMAVGIVIVATGSPASVMTRLAIAAAAVAAGTAFTLDDPASVTLAASPTSRPARRFARVACVAVVTGMWWAAAAAVASSRMGALPLRGLALELAAFVAVALAVSATAASQGDQTGGGVAGVVVVVACYGSTFLPPRWWLPFPAYPSAPGASARLTATFALAACLLAVTSRDPASRTVSIRRRDELGDRRL